MSAVGTTARFEATTPDGALVMTVAVAGRAEPRSAVEAALHLAAAEPLLEALDGWLALAGTEAPAWAWAAPSPADAPRQASGAEAEWDFTGADGASVSVRLACPWPLLRRLPEPSGAATGLVAHARWPAVPAVCVRAALDLASDEAAALEPGGVLLLPASFEPDAPLVWRAADERAGAGIVVSAGVTQDVLAGEATAPWEVRQSWPAVSPAALAGWPGATWPALPSGGPALALWWQPPGGRPARQGARGRLLPWGDGQAMWLNDVEANAWT